VEDRLKAYLVLGCNGLTSPDKFIFCNGIQNPIIDLTRLSEDQYLELLNFFDNACDLFNSPMNDYNKCVNTLSLLYKNYNAYDQTMLSNIQSFIKNHKGCGIWLMLILKEDFKND
jgi:hypothetical protein